jgi:hypothetical protein
MTRIDGIQHIVSLIQAGSAWQSLEAASGRREKRNERALKEGEGEVASRLRLQLAAIERDSPERRRRVLRALVESALTLRVGEALLLDPAFFRMVEDVQVQMEGAPQVRRLVDDAISQLGDATTVERSKL